MRKKEANLYSLPSTLENPPYLSSQELDEFESEFTLFDNEVDIHKLKETFPTSTQMRTENYEPIQRFVNRILSKKHKCTFAEYISLMIEFFSSQNEGELAMDMLSDNKKEMPARIVREVLEEAMSREVSEKELADILWKVFEVE